jgi:hypothetical protein
VAFVQPPQRPGAVLWSIAAGPLVNVVLIPCLWYANHQALRGGYSSDVSQFMRTIHFMNLGLLIFNMIPIYPLDGGQILRALLWYVMGAARSLLVASILGIAGALVGFAFLFLRLTGEGRVWLTIMLVFALSQSWRGLQMARVLAKLLALPRTAYAHCSSCGQSPPAGPMWRCHCGNGVDIFACHGICPHCGISVHQVACPFCGVPSPVPAWVGANLSPLDPAAIPAGALDNPD